MAKTLARIIGDSGLRQSRAGLTRRIRHRRLARSGAAEPTDFDPLDLDVLADPYPWYRALLEGGPVHYSRKRKIWIISRYSDVRAAARAHHQLSSAESVTRLRSRLPMMLTIDRPEHTRLRRLAAGDFSRAALERWRPQIERLAAEALDRMLAEGATDVASQLASPLPVAAIARVLGIPPEDLADFRHWSDRVVEGFGVDAGMGSLSASARVLGSTLKLHSYFRGHFERRRRNPGDDVLSRLLVSSQEGQLSDDELFWFALLLLVAGNETTTNLLGTMTLAFAEHPKQFDRVRADPELVPAAVEESLRYVAPIQGFYRTAATAHSVGSVTIPAGARVLLLFGAANRDPRRYPNPDRFEVERNPTDHLAFGSGIHFCLGAHLARIEGQVVLRELIGRVGRIELAGEPGWNQNPNLRGLSRLPVRLIPAESGLQEMNQALNLS